MTQKNYQKIFLYDPKKFQKNFFPGTKNNFNASVSLEANTIHIQGTPQMGPKKGGRNPTP